MNLSNIQSIDEIRNITNDYLKYYGITLRPDRNVLLDDKSTNKFGFLISQGNNHITSNAYYDGSKWKYLNNGAASLAAVLNFGGINFYQAVLGNKDEEITWISIAIISTIGLNLPTLSAYANNAAALAGGLVAGDLYRTNGDPDVVCIVH